MIADVPLYIDGEEVVERPRFKTEKEFADYIVRISEGRDMTIVVDHPHTEDCDVIGVWIGCEATYKCPKGCDA
jgi:hypothetical protein